MSTNGSAAVANGNGTAAKTEDSKKLPYQGKQPYGMPSDLIVPNMTDIENYDERLWVPQADGVEFRPLLFNTTFGYFVNVLRVRQSGILSRHRHTGPVCAVTLKGRWHYLEHDWWAEEGTFSMEPPGETHTLEVPHDCDKMVTLFHVVGSYVYVDPYGKAERIEDVFTKMQMAREHYEKVGLGADFVDQLIR